MLKVGGGRLPLLGLLDGILFPDVQLADFLSQFLLFHFVLVVQASSLLKMDDLALQVGDLALEVMLFLVEVMGLLSNLLLDLRGAALAVKSKLASCMVDGIVEATNLGVLLGQLVLDIVESLLFLVDQIHASLQLQSQLVGLV